MLRFRRWMGEGRGCEEGRESIGGGALAVRQRWDRTETDVEICKKGCNLRGNRRQGELSFERELKRVC